MDAFWDGVNGVPWSVWGGVFMAMGATGLTRGYLILRGAAQLDALPVLTPTQALEHLRNCGAGAGAGVAAATMAIVGRVHVEPGQALHFVTNAAEEAKDLASTTMLMTPGNGSAFLGSSGGADSLATTATTMSMVPLREGDADVVQHLQAAVSATRILRHTLTPSHFFMPSHSSSVVMQQLCEVPFGLTDGQTVARFVSDTTTTTAANNVAHMPLRTIVHTVEESRPHVHLVGGGGGVGGASISNNGGGVNSSSNGSIFSGSGSPAMDAADIADGKWVAEERIVQALLVGTALTCIAHLQLDAQGLCLAPPVNGPFPLIITEETVSSVAASMRETGRDEWWAGMALFCVGGVFMGIAVRGSVRRWLQRRREQRAREYMLSPLHTQPPPSPAVLTPLTSTSEQPATIITDCIVCCSKPANTVILDCGHQVLCVGCCEALAETAAAPRCPVCRSNVVRFVRVFGA